MYFYLIVKTSEALFEDQNLDGFPFTAKYLWCTSEFRSNRLTDK